MGVLSGGDYLRFQRAYTNFQCHGKSNAYAITNVFQKHQNTRYE